MSLGRCHFSCHPTVCHRGSVMAKISATCKQISNQTFKQCENKCHSDRWLAKSCYGKIYFILGGFLSGRSIIDLLLLSHIIQRLSMDDSYFWPTTLKLCFRLFGKCETAHLHGSKLGLYYCCSGEGDSLGVYRTSIETLCGQDKMWIWTSISGRNERHSQQM